MFDKTAQPESVWRPVYEKTGGTCAYCGEKVDPRVYGKCDEALPGVWIVEHWKAASTFADDDPARDDFDNLWVGCCSCNVAKGVLPGAKYIAQRIQKKEPVSSHPAVKAKVKRELVAARSKL